MLEELDAPLSATEELQAIYAEVVEAVARPYMQGDNELYSKDSLAVMPAPAGLSLAGCFASSRLPPNSSLVMNDQLYGPVRYGVDTRTLSYAARPHLARLDPAHPAEVRRVCERVKICDM